MDRPSFLAFSFIGLWLMALLHLAELWMNFDTVNIVQLILEWLPIYSVWIALVVIGLVKRVSNDVDLDRHSYKKTTP